MTNVLNYNPPAQRSVGSAVPALLNVPPTVVNLGIVAVGLGTGFVAFRYRKKPLGILMAGAGASIAGAGFVFMLLDLFGRKPA
jgi:hypothetical protein